MGFLGVAVILKSVLVSQPRKSHYCITNSTMTAVGNKFFPYYVTNQPAARRIIIWRKFRIFSFAEVHVRTTQRTLLDYLRTSMTKFFFLFLQHCWYVSCVIDLLGNMILQLVRGTSNEISVKWYCSFC